MDDMELEQKPVEEQLPPPQKKGIKLGEQERILLMFLVIVAVLFSAYYFGYKKLNAATLEVKEEKNELMERYQALYPLAQNKDQYIKETASLEEEIDSILSGYATGTTQERMIMLAKSFEEDTDVWFSTLSMSETTANYTFGQVMSTNPSGDGGRAYSTNMVGHQTTLSLGYSTNYENLKTLIDYINTYEDNKFTINSLSISSSDGNSVSGAIELISYDITGSDRAYDNVSIYDVALGNDNPFISKLTTMLAASSIVSNYDLFVSVLPYEAGSSNVAVGLNKDALNKHGLDVEGNSVQSITIVVSGTNNDYKVSYKLGDKMYPADNYFEGADFECGDTIDLLVISSSRSGTEDKSSVKINITNSTDKTVNMYIYGDDTKNPRVSLGTTSGSVNVEN
jgi:hypothetical protein